jgi:carbonic anhydrase/acetyltransferase-like protein (isoleucine patch superfamily)
MSLQLKSTQSLQLSLPRSLSLSQPHFQSNKQTNNTKKQRPVVSAGCFVAPNASVIGEVLLFNHVSIWYGAVLRGDKSKIKIGHMTNVQDRAVVNTVTSLDSGFPSDVEVGNWCTIGHGALLTSCVVGDRVLVGQGAIIQEGCEVSSDSIIAAGAVLMPGTVVPSGQLWAGNPAVFKR